MKVSKDAEMIDFCRENYAVLPQLYKVACRVLCVPASSAASERVFDQHCWSPAGKAANQIHQSEYPESTNALLFLHSNIKQSCDTDLSDRTDSGVLIRPIYEFFA